MNDIFKMTHIPDRPMPERYEDDPGDEPEPDNSPCLETDARLIRIHHAREKMASVEREMAAAPRHMREAMRGRWRRANYVLSKAEIVIPYGSTPMPFRD
jgi:hypothetical protein